MTNWTFFTNSFLLDAWVGILATGLISILLLFVTHAYFENGCWQHLVTLKSLCAFVCHSYIGRRYPQEPAGSSSRIAFVSISFCGFMLITLYRSMISASLSIKFFYAPIRSIEDVVDSPYKLLVINGSSVHDMFYTDDYHQILINGKVIPVKDTDVALEQHVIPGR